MAEPLVTPAWLDSQIKAGNANLRILDTTITIAGPAEEDFKRDEVPQENHTAFPAGISGKNDLSKPFQSCAHIEGSQYLNLFKHTTPTQYVPINVPDPTGFQEYLRDLGINTTSHVVICENTPIHAICAPRVWFILRAYGVKNVSLLDGGLKRWQAEGYPVTDRLVQYQKGDVNVAVDKALVRTYDDVIAPSDVLYVDTRPPENFSGEEEEPSKYLSAFMPAIGLSKEGFTIHTGHVPGAVSLPYPMLFQEDMVSYKPKEQLLELFQKQGVKLSGHVTATCYVGLTACMFALCASVCGFKDVSLYPGSWVEYGQRAPADRVERSVQKKDTHL